MGYLLRSLAIVWVFLAMGCASAQNFTARFSGPAVLTNYQAPDKPTKTKEFMTFDLASNGTCVLDLQENQSQRTGNWYPEGRYVYLKLSEGGGYLTGRLLLKGKPGDYKGMSGILNYSHNGYSGMFDYKLNVKGEVL